ncbi:uncharacterized protein LOC130810811 [Amaranthus tricolor]|uniref:uncharacterized protein LOC130810811 n=1 Tax=Amaranthus tricolor TaxID=29722 RepID=UPI0025884592|nr:uncharacterized protein LOC130810811 [Amaranthus tricolor]
MERNNDRLLNLMEKQMSHSHEDDEGKFYKRLSSHQPPKYDREPDPVRFEDWIAEMEKLLEAINCPSRMKVKLAAFYLPGTAELWWRTVKQTVIDSTWEQFIKKLRDQFYLPSLQRKKENEFLFLRQGTMSVIEYASKFRELARFATEIVISDRGKAIRFFEGLNLRIQKGTPRYQDFDDFTIKPWSMSVFLKKKTGKKSFQTVARPTQWKCRLCGKDHRGRNSNGKIVYYKCHKEGHMANNCGETFYQTKTTSEATGNRAFGTQRNETRASIGLLLFE